MTRNELLSKLENIEKELGEVRQYLSQDSFTAPTNVTERAMSAPIDLKGYSLEDLYNELGKSKHYSIRLRNALEKRGIYTLPDFLSLSPGELLDLEGIGYETLIRTKKALDKMGITW